MPLAFEGNFCESPPYPGLRPVQAHLSNSCRRKLHEALRVMAKEEELSHRKMPFLVQWLDDLMVDDGQ